MKIVVFALLLSAHCELTTALKRQYFHFSNETTWTQAQSLCRTYYVDLLSVDRQEEVTALQNIGTENWIGLRQISNSWQWSDGGNNSFINWADREPNLSGNDNCATVKDGKLKDHECTDRHDYYCYNWDTKLIVVKENKSWEDALQYCRTHYTDLASLPTGLHFTQAKQTVANTSSVWTGLRFLAGSWFWLSREDLGYLGTQLPPCPANHTYCGSLNMKTQRWENRDCMEKRNFVCY